jgi:hypothetical protein
MVLLGKLFQIHRPYRSTAPATFPNGDHQHVSQYVGTATVLLWSQLRRFHAEVSQNVETSSRFRVAQRCANIIAGSTGSSEMSQRCGTVSEGCSVTTQEHRARVCAMCQYRHQQRVRRCVPAACVPVTRSSSYARQKALRNSNSPGHAVTDYALTRSCLNTTQAAGNFSDWSHGPWRSEASLNDRSHHDNYCARH